MKGFRYPAHQSNLGAVIVVIIDEKTGNLALVCDRMKPSPHYWKFPGGKIEECDIDPQHRGDVEGTAARAAKREGDEETGLNVKVDPDKLAIIRKQSHDQYAFMALADFSRLAATGDEGEEVRSFTLEQVLELPDFFPNHRQLLELALAKLGIAVPA